MTPSSVGEALRDIAAQMRLRADAVWERGDHDTAHRIHDLARKTEALAAKFEEV